MTFNDGLNEAVRLLSTHTQVFRTACSVSFLTPVSGPTASNQLYIDAILAQRRDDGLYEDGIAAAIDTLSHMQVARGQTGWTLVPVESTDQRVHLFVAELQKILIPQST